MQRAFDNHSAGLATSSMTVCFGFCIFLDGLLARLHLNFSLSFTCERLPSCCPAINKFVYVRLCVLMLMLQLQET